MSHFRKIATIAAVLAICPLTAQAAPNTYSGGSEIEASVTDSTQKLYDKAVDIRQDARDWTRDTRHDAKDAWRDLGVKYKVHKLQSDVRPYGNEIKSTMGGVLRPAKKFFGWVDHYMSVYALMLILASLSVMYFMATAKPETHNGAR